MTNKRLLSIQKLPRQTRTEDCVRMEVALQRHLIRQARDLARQNWRPFWSVVK